MQMKIYVFHDDMMYIQSIRWVHEYVKFICNALHVHYVYISCAEVNQSC